MSLIREILPIFIGFLLAQRTSKLFDVIAERLYLTYQRIRKRKLLVWQYRKLLLLYWVTDSRTYRVPVFRWNLPSYRYALRKDNERYSGGGKVEKLINYWRMDYQRIFDRDGKRIPEEDYTYPDNKRGWELQRENAEVLARYYRFPHVR